jgi:MFS family permease
MANGTPGNEQRALRAVSVQFLINGAVAASYIPRLPEIRNALDVDLVTIGQIITLASLGGLLGSLLAGRIVTTYSTRSAMIFGTMALVALLPMIGLASTTTALLLILMAITLLDVVVDVAMNIQGSNLSARRATPVMNRLHGLWSIGSVIGGLIAAGMAALAVPLLWHLTGAALLMALGLWYVGGGLLKSDTAQPHPDNPAVNARHRSGGRTGLWVFFLFGALAFVPEMVGSDWAPFRLSDDLQAAPGVAGLAYVAFTSGMVTGRLSGDFLAVKLGKHRLLNLSILLATSGLLLACLVDISLITFAGLTLAGLGISVLFPALYDAAAQDKQHKGNALGAMTAGSRAVMLITPVGLGLLADLPQLSVGMAMALVAIPCLLLLSYLVRRTY